jgi:hypothetical protein
LHEQKSGKAMGVVNAGKSRRAISTGEIYRCVSTRDPPQEESREMSEYELMSHCCGSSMFETKDGKFICDDCERECLPIEAEENNHEQ